jgi:hypothetical protein
MAQAERMVAAHSTSGENYVVEFAGDTVIAAVGPVHYRDLMGLVDLEDFDLDQDTGDWIDENRDEFGFESAARWIERHPNA